MVKYKLYWEDINERVLYAELDDYAWKLPEKLFGYKKQNSLYLFHKNKLAAYYSAKDSKKESEVGYNYYQKNNFNRIINLKIEALKKVKDSKKQMVKIDINKLGSEDLKKVVLQALDIFRESLSVHYLTQPQFFAKFEQINPVFYKKRLGQISKARLNYTRVAWVLSMKLCKDLLKEYGKRNSLKLEEIESLFYSEIKSNRFDRKKIKERIKKFALVSKNHVIKIYTGKVAEKLIKRYENYKDISLVKGIIGNKGRKTARAFVVKNENLDFKKLPKGMKRGMILIVQNAWPELSKYYKLASAIVTNEGGITSHGVVVAREFKIPCIVGTKIATKIFKTGNLVEVDANKGIVRKV